MKRIILDAFFHMMPGHRLSRNIFTGGYRTNYGRYCPFDIYHPNGASMLYSDLLADYDVKFLNQPYCEMTLADADILVVASPDYPLYEGSSPYRIDAPDIEALSRFLNRGGSVVLLINSFLSRSDFWEENFDLERVTPLLDRLGIKWDNNYMSDDNSILPARHGEMTVGYGQGGRVENGVLPIDATPLLTCDGETFGFVKTFGRGKLAVLGDAGLVSNGLYHFPGFDNAAFVTKLFSEMSPAWEPGPSQIFERFQFGHLSCSTSDRGITEALFKTLRPQARFEIDHHYRHLTFEGPPATVPRDELEGLMPLELKSISGKKTVTAEFPLVNICDGYSTASVRIKLNVSEKKCEIGTDYLISGTEVSNDLNWSDVGADPIIFGAIGDLVRVNTVIQILAGTHPDGTLRYFTIKQGQILYDRNVNNPHYGFDILLASRNLVLSRLSP